MSVESITDDYDFEDDTPKEFDLDSLFGDTSPPSFEDDEAEVEQDDEENQADEHGDTEEDRDRAMKTGWAPKEQFRGNPKLWKPAHEWNDNRSAIDRLTQDRQQMQQELSSMKSDFEQQKQAIMDFQEAERDRMVREAIADYQAEIRELIRNGDEDEALQKIKELGDFKGGQVSPPKKQDDKKQQPEANPLQQAIVEWAQDKPWASNDDDPRSQLALKVIRRYAGGSLGPYGIMEEVDKALAEMDGKKANANKDNDPLSRKVTPGRRNYLSSSSSVDDVEGLGQLDAYETQYLSMMRKTTVYNRAKGEAKAKLDKEHAKTIAQMRKQRRRNRG